MVVRGNPFPVVVRGLIGTLADLEKFVSRNPWVKAVDNATLKNGRRNLADCMKTAEELRTTTQGQETLGKPVRCSICARNTLPSKKK